jgi:ABC-type sugar transport system ATPase subunit
LAAKKTTVIFISHKLEEIFEICHRVTVFRDGQYIDTMNCQDTSKNKLIAMIVGRELTQLFPRGEAHIAGTVMEVKNLSKTGVFDNINFEVRQGEILGFSGLMGAGRTEIMRAIFGIDPFDSGEIYINGKLCRIRHSRDAVKAGIGMVTEDRLRLGSIYALSVMANVTIANFFRMCVFNFFRQTWEAKIFEESRKTLAIKCASPRQLISQLSGGNQQKAIIARWLLTKPKVLILDEPTRGIDVGSKAEIHRLIGNLAQQGMAIILISSEMPEIMGMSDRILVIRQGKIVYECYRENVSQETLITHAFGQHDKGELWQQKN